MSYNAQNADNNIASHDRSYFSCIMYVGSYLGVSINVEHYSSRIGQQDNLENVHMLCNSRPLIENRSHRPVLKIQIEILQSILSMWAIQ